jgi:hypothetical protein
LPDWLKGSNVATTLPENETVQIDPVTTLPKSEIFTNNDMQSLNENISDLPSWMQGMDHESLKQEVHEELDNSSPSLETRDAASFEAIPDWLKNTSTEPADLLIESEPV